MIGELHGKRALVTGAASGIGRAIAVAFAREGATVAVHARNEERAEETINEITAKGGTAFTTAAELLDPIAIKRMCEKAVAGMGGIDIVVNNAGISEYVSAIEMSEEMWNRTMNINLKAAFLVSKYTLPIMIEKSKGGRMIFISSTNGKKAIPLFSAYNASKHGLIGFARTLAAEVGNQGITVNTICPGWVDTKMAVDFHKRQSDETGVTFETYWQESMADTNMLKVIITPDDVADCAVFLASKKARCITAQAINLCGGLCYW